MVPVQFLLVVSTVHDLRPRFNHLVCNMDAAEVKQMQTFLVVDILVEAVIAIATYVCLRRRGARPLDMMRGFTSMHFSTMMAIAINVFVYFMVQQHSHIGMDLSFEFAWLRKRAADWHCGLNWGGEAGQN